MSNSYDDFLHRYNVKSINVNRSGYSKFDYYKATATTYYNDHNETVDIEMSRSGFENLVSIDREYNRMWQDERDEIYFRKHHPAVKEAYDKYRMLLELYR